MEFDVFKKNIEIISYNNSLREKYIRAFIDTDGEYYKKHIATTHKYVDGICYIGYLWDCLKNSETIDMECIHQKLQKDDVVFVMWDIHTKERIFIDNYWKFNKEDILSLKVSLLFENLKYLPEDIYLFDHTFEWSFVLTHEEVNDERWCLKAQPFK